MVVLAVATDLEESMDIYNLSEKIWAEKNGNIQPPSAFKPVSGTEKW